MSKVKSDTAVATTVSDAFTPKLITPEIVAGVRAVHAALEEVNNSASNVAESMHALGFRPEHLLVGTDSKPNPQYNRALWFELVEAIITAPNFGNLNRDAVRAKIAGHKAPNADAATIRRIAMGKVNAAISRIRDALAKVDPETGRTKKKTLTLHEILDGFAYDALEAIKAKCDKAGLTSDQINGLQAAWREVRAKTNAAFKAK